MSWIEIPQDERHAMRVYPQGTVVLRRYEETLRGRILDLATGGAGLRSDFAFGVDDELVGHVMRVDITLDRAAVGWSIVGHIVRAVAANRMIAVAFDDVPSELEDYVQDQLLDVVEHDVLYTSSSSRSRPGGAPRSHTRFEPLDVTSSRGRLARRSHGSSNRAAASSANRAKNPVPPQVPRFGPKHDTPRDAARRLT